MAYASPPIAMIKDGLLTYWICDVNIKKTDRLILFWHPAQLLQRKNRPVLAHVFLADVAVSADADPAFHPIFQRHDDVVV